MKAVLNFLLALVFCFSVLATNIQYGKITIQITNQPPVITNLTILPEKPYYDSKLTCRAVIMDESASTVRIEYRWYKNGELIGKNEALNQNLNDYDEIICAATPIDWEDLRGKTVNVSTVIQATPARVKLVKPILNMIGIKVSAKTLSEATSMSAVTGMATGARDSSGLTLLFLLTIIIVILIGLNLAAILLRIKRATRS